MFSGYMLNTDYGAPVFKMVLWLLGIRNAEKIYLPVKGAPQPFSFVIIFLPQGNKGGDKWKPDQTEKTVVQCVQSLCS